MTDPQVRRVVHVPATWQGPEDPGITYVHDQNPDQITQAAADAQAKANQALTAGGSGYHFDPDSATSIIKEFEDLLVWIKTDLRPHAAKLKSVKPMGDEIGSENYVRDINAAGDSYGIHLDSVVTELTRQKDAIKAARDAYLQQEQHAADALKGRHTQHD